MEADAVLAIIQTELKSKRNLSIGVVTFNARQQMLISDLLDQHLTNWPKDLFVKNIENVQGDERDLIIFSIGYAPDANGRLNVQFGSLSQAGGENRLNVAVSRARQKVIVVTSIQPEDLKVEQTKNKGPKQLKSYLNTLEKYQKRK